MIAARPQMRLPWQRGSTAHTCSIYPFSVHHPMTHQGVVVGIDMLTANAFCWDPFEAYASGLVSNPNVAVFGQPGQRKSTLVKTYLSRMLGLYGDRRWVAVADPKGEYTPLADRLGLQVVRLSPGGGTRVNPLAPGPAAAHEDPDQTLLRRAETVRDLVATTLRRDLRPDEEAALHAAVETVTRGRTVEPTLGDLAALLTHPTEEMASQLQSEPDQISSDCRDLYYGLASLLSHALRGMFDGHGTVRLAEGSQGVVLDLSGIDPGSQAMPVALMAATGWLQEYLACPGPQRLLVVDELWLGAGDRHFVRHMQRAVKLGRAYGTANIQIAHKVTDGAAQADSGTSEAKIAAGLLADCDTKVILRQDPEQLDAAQRTFGLTSTERDWVGSLARGRALWLVGGRRAVVQHYLGSHERDSGMVETDQRMGLRPPSEAIDQWPGEGR